MSLNTIEEGLDLCYWESIVKGVAEGNISMDSIHPNAKEEISKDVEYYLETGQFRSEFDEEYQINDESVNCVVQSNCDYSSRKCDLCKRDMNNNDNGDLEDWYMPKTKFISNIYN